MNDFDLTFEESLQSFDMTAEEESKVFNSSYGEWQRGPQGPKGDKGDRGDDGTNGINGTDGTDGISPIITITDIPNGHRVTVTDADGTRYFDIPNGAKGDQGVQGIQGPVGPAGPTDWNKITNKPTIPSKTSQLTNDSSFLKSTDTYEAWRLSGGVVSVNSSSKAISINPAINGIGNIRKMGGEMHFFVDGKEVYLPNSSWDNLFDGKASTYCHFNVNPNSDTRNEWTSSTEYETGQLTFKKVDGLTTNPIRWYRAKKSNVNFIPTDEQDNECWEYLRNPQGASTDSYKQYIPFVAYGMTLSIEVDTKSSVGYENGISIYWRAAYQNAPRIKVYKWDGVKNDWHTNTFTQTYVSGDVSNTLYLGNIPTNFPSNKFKIEFTAATDTWCAMVQLAVTGLRGGLEGTTLNRNGDSVFGDIYPYTWGNYDLGRINQLFRYIYGRYFIASDYIKIGNTTLNETQLKKLLALI